MSDIVFGGQSGVNGRVVITPLFADCTPTQAGEQKYVAVLKDIRFCDGSNWYSLKGSSTGQICPVPGELKLDALGEMVFCDGTN